MKKSIWILSIIGMLGLINCGGSSDEAKELLQRLLRLVGIPQTIVVNICQDKNLDGICGLSERQEKVSIKKGESISAIFIKLENTEDGKYLLETASPELPLLLVLKDNESQDYTEEFTIPFTGLEVTQIEKNLSLLQAMVDAGYLTTTEILPVETMKNQDVFYATLLKDFELNLKTLTDKELSSPRAVLANLQEVATELKDAGLDVNLTNEVDACNDDVTCVEEAMKETIISDEEAVVIENNETQKTKNALESKVFYFSYFEEGVIQTEKTTVSTDATNFTWINVSGPGEGNTGEGTFDIKGNKVSSLDDGYTALRTVTDMYLVFDSYKNDDSFDSSRTYYFDRTNAEAQLVNNDDSNDDKKLVKDLVSGHVTFKQESQNTTVPSNAWVRIVPSRNQTENNYRGVNCKIESNGNFGSECYVNDEEALRNDFANTSETFQVVVYADTNADKSWNKEEESYGFLGNNVSNGAWNEFEINLNIENTNTETSNFNFSDIGSDTTALSSPNGGEKWIVGQTETIKWNTSSINGSTVDIYVLHDDPSNLHDFSSSLNNLLTNKEWYQFGINISNTGSYTVDPKDLNGGGNAYVILISGVQSGWDVSDSTITLSGN